MDQDFPYYYHFLTEKELLTDFDRLSKFKKKNLKPASKQSLFTMELNYKSYIDLIMITDYFSEECRIRCSYGGKISPYMWYQKEYERLKQMEWDDYTDWNLFFRKSIKACNNFATPIAISVYKYFKPTRILDFSAGWGDRLIAALAYKNADYIGVDPSKCMKEKYIKMIKFFQKHRKMSKTYKVINKPFEEYSPKTEYFDLVFTSPPFFDLEVYESPESTGVTQGTQSIDSWKSIEDWKYNFLFPSVKKSFDALTGGGHLAIYIDDTPKIKYVNEMLTYIKQEIPGFTYKGTINWINVTGARKPRNIYVFAKRFS